MEVTKYFYNKYCKYLKYFREREGMMEPINRCGRESLQKVVSPLLSTCLCRNHEESTLGSLCQYGTLMNISSRISGLNIA